MVHLSQLVGALGIFSLAIRGVKAASQERSTQPNIIFILADDLDAQMTGPEYMPLTKKHIADQGIVFPRHYCTVSLCCPSRASILTGQNAHNHNVTDVSDPGGGWPKWRDLGLNDKYLATFFQSAGYGTYYVGKLFNQLNIINYIPFPKGWTGSEILLDPYTYNFFNPGLLRNYGVPWVYKNKYSTDVVAEKAFGFLDDAMKVQKRSGKPFFLGIAPVAPHSEVIVPDLTDTSKLITGPPRPAPRHENLFPDAQVPRGDNFNPDRPSGAGWVKGLARLNQTEVENGDAWYRARLQSLQAIDEMVGDLFSKLEEYGILDNTYVIFSSDNGYHISQHRLTPGKTCGYEEDINVPLYIRGPGIEKGSVSEAVTAHIDLLPTFFRMAGINQRDDFDGTPIPLTQDDPETRIEHVNIEMWKSSFAVHRVALPRDVEIAAQNTYKSIRLIGNGYSFYYSVWCTNDHELYDMQADIYQMNNLVPGGFNSSSDDLEKPIAGTTVRNLALRLDALLFVEKTCRGDTCREPWEALIPDSGISSLSEALDPKYDDFFEGVPKVSFSDCLDVQGRWAEGPQFDDWAIMS